MGNATHTPPPRVGVLLGTAGVFGPYLVAFGAAIVSAMVVFFEPSRSAEAQHDPMSVAVIAGFGAVGIAIALLLTRQRTDLTWRELGIRKPGRAGAWGFIGAIALAYLGMKVAFAVAALVPSTAYGVDNKVGAVDAVSVIGSAVESGVIEEFLVLAFPVALMTAMRWSWPVQILVLAVLRAAYHLYYGFTAIALGVVWMVLFWWLYQRIQSVWPFIIAHTSYDLIGAAGPAGAIVGWALILFGILTFTMQKYWRQPHCPLIA